MSRRNRRALAQIVPVSKLPPRESEELPTTAEIATIRKAEFLDPVQIREFPNFSSIINYRSNGEGLRFYDTMLGTDADLAGFFQDLYDDVLQYPAAIRAASDSAEHLEHADFVKFALGEIPHFQNVMRHLLDSYARGFAVAEKVYKSVDRGRWAGAVVYAEIIDKPQRWFNFGLDRRLYLRTPAGDLPGQLLPQQKFAVVTWGSNNIPWGRPMLDLTYYPWFLKHHAMKNQSIHFEKWAQPTPIGEYEPSSDKATNDKRIEQTLGIAMSIQTDTAIAIPRGMALRLLESMRNGSISYEQYIDQLTRMQSRVVTGQVLTTSGDSGGSYALGEVHERKEKNRVKTLARFAVSQVSRLFIRELIDRNYGPQEAYSRYEIICLSSAERLSEAAVEAAQQKVGHQLSKAFSASRNMIVEGEGEDVLEPPVQLLNQPSGAAGGFAAPEPKRKTALFAAPPRELEEKVRTHAEKTQKKLESIGAQAAKTARSAFKKIVRSIASSVRGRKKLSRIDKPLLFKALQSAPLAELGQVYDRMLLRPEKVPATGLAEGGPPDVSTGAKLALTLSLLGIVDRFSSEVEEAKETEKTPDELADFVMDEHGADIPGYFGNTFEAVHETNIVSVHAARLQQQLQDPGFRRRNPYVMIVAMPDTRRLGHRMMDGYIVSAEDALGSQHLPPYDFGCRCRAVPIPASLARESGLTGANPLGSIGEWLEGQGARADDFGRWVLGGERFTAGVVSGFDRATAGIDVSTQLFALREKAEQLRREDPAAWASLVALLIWLYGYNVLTQDPPDEEEEFDDEEFN